MKRLLDLAPSDFDWNGLCASIRTYFHVLSFEHNQKKIPSYKTGLGNFIPFRSVLHEVKWSVPFVFLN